MGSDDLFKKRKARVQRSLVRESNKKEEYDKFLVVSEDTKSSCFYIKEAIAYYRIQSANFAVIGLGQDPLNIVEEAERRYAKESSSNKPDFDRVYCVFDRDSHKRYYPALAKIDAINKEIGSESPVFIAITSDPAFELWLLLHFGYTSKLYEKTQKKSAAGLVLDDLLVKSPIYKKGSEGIFKEYLPKFPDAIENAKRLRKYCDDNGILSPKTNMDELMVYIRDIKKK